MSPKYVRHRGIALVWAAILLLLMILLIGLSLDTGKVALVNHQLHNAADAGALAGCRIVKTDPDQARVLARDTAAMNFAAHDPVILDLNTSNSPDGDIIIGRYGYDPVQGISFFTPAVDLSTEPVNALAVISSRNESHGGSLPLNFGAIVDVPTVNLTGWWQGKAGPYAIAMTAGGTGAGLICLRHDEIGLDIQGDTNLIVNNDITQKPNDGAIQVNSFHDDGMNLEGSKLGIHATAINMCADNYEGNIDLDGLDVEYFNFRQPPLPDPLWELKDDPPEYGAWNEVSKFREPSDPYYNARVTPGEPTELGNGEVATFQEGYYSGGFRLTKSNCKAIFTGGVYTLGGESATGKESGLYISGGNMDARRVEGENRPGVMFYVVGDGVVNISGGGEVWADPMQEGPYEHVTIFQDQYNVQSATIIGGGGLDLNGTLYFPQQTNTPSEPNTKGQYALHIGGQGDGFGNQIIADSLYIHGTGDVIIDYDGRNPAPTTKAFLVE